MFSETTDLTIGANLQVPSTNQDLATTSRFPDLTKYKTLQEFLNLEVKINGEIHKFNPNTVKFSDMLDYSAELQSGMVLTMNQDTNEMTMNITKEYALKSKKVMVELASKLFNVRIEDQTIDLETWLFLMEVVDASGFMKRLEALNKLK
jgi:hypothetical protein